MWSRAINTTLAVGCGGVTCGSGKAVMPCLRMQVVTATATLRLMGDTALLAPAPDGPGLGDEPQALSATAQ